jgi:hypothetical protein
LRKLKAISPSPTSTTAGMITTSTSPTSSARAESTRRSGMAQRSRTTLLPALAMSATWLTARSSSSALTVTRRPPWVSGTRSR